MSSSSSTDNTAPQSWRMVPYAITSASGQEIYRGYLEAAAGADPASLVEEAREEFVQEQYNVYGDDKGKLYGTLQDADSVVIGAELTEREHAEDIRQHPAWAHRSDKLTGHTAQIGSQLPGHVFDQPDGDLPTASYTQPKPARNQPDLSL